MADARTESIGYCEAVLSNNKTQLLFIMPCTRTEAELYLC